MSEIDLSGVAPLRRAETRRRIIIIQEYLSLTNPKAEDRTAAAESLGVGTQQFMNLVRAWRLHGEANAIAKAGAKAGAPRRPRKRGLPPSTRTAAEDALRALPASASHQEAIAAVHAMCRQRETRTPSDSMISYLRLAIRQSGEVVGGEPGLVIGRAIVGLPMLESRVLTLPEIVLGVDGSDGRIVAAALVRPGACAPKDFASAVCAAGPNSDSVRIGSDDAMLAEALSHAQIISRFASGRLLAKVLGRGVQGVRLSYGPLASTDPKRALRAKADSPLDLRETLETLEAVLSAHNASRCARTQFLRAHHPSFEGASRLDDRGRTAAHRRRSDLFGHPD